MNYVRPVLVFSLPMILFFAGVSFAIGEWTRRPVLIFVLPTVLLLVFGLFMSNWSPSWLTTQMNQALMLIDPYGFRWLRETWLKVDLGTDFYNTQPMVVDAVFAVSRVVFGLIGLGAAAVTARHFAHTFRAVRHGVYRPEQLGAGRSEAAAVGMESALPVMRMQPPGLLRGMLTVARFETKLLLFHPGVYLFIPFIILQATGTAELREGVFGTPLLHTPGTLAMGLMDTLTLLVCLLLLFFSVDSLERERSTGLAPIFHATAVPTFALLMGKTLAVAVLGALILLATLLACLVLLLVQGTVPIHLQPFGLVWGLMLVPTFVVWAAAVSFLMAVTRNRYTTFAIAAALLAFTFYRQFTGHMNWVGNWNLWGIAQWSDISRFELDGAAIVLNRLYVLALAVLLAFCSVRLFGRQDFDAAAVVRWFWPSAIARTVLRSLVFVLPPLALGIALWLSVNRGYQGQPSKDRQKDYWRQNMATWREAPDPALQHVELDLRLDPARRRFHAKGVYRLQNQRSEPLIQIALTTGLHWENEHWTLDGKSVTPEDRSRLLVFELPQPMKPDETVQIGFEYGGRFPRGISKNGGGTGEFILPSAVVLTSFSPSFVPVVGYVEEIGVDEENRYEPRQYDDHFYEGDTLPLFGTGDAFSTHITIHGPKDFIYNSVGVLEQSSTEGDERTVVWKSDYPVSFFNVVAGRWKVLEGERTKVFYDAQHEYNVKEMSLALESAYTYYSQWFMPYPWQELKLSEFANLATYAQGFPTNITFSEGIGFLTKDKPGANAAFLVTAHEAAHQWWGNLLVPGKGPGGNILSEGTAHFSTGLLMEQVKGLAARIEFFETIERMYNERRSADAERPLVKIDGSKDGDTTVMYDKGGWVFWMLLNHLGRDKMLQGMQQFMRDFRAGTDHPVLQDFVAMMRPLAEDPQAYDAFVHQWFFEVVVPQYQFKDVNRRKLEGGNWEVTGLVSNVGTGRMPVEVTATAGDRFDDQGKPRPEYQDERQVVVLAAGEEASFTLVCAFEPKELTVDPDRLVLQLKRKQAQHTF